MNLYDVLGIKSDATQKEIRAAYKRLAQKYHPDKEHGNAEMFNKIAHAFNVLGSETRREKYDLNGDESEPPNIEQMIQSAMADIFQHLIDAPYHVDIKAEAIKIAEKSMSDPRQERDHLTIKKGKLMRQIGRVKTTGEENMFEGAVRAAVSRISSRIEYLDQQITVLEQATERLMLYKDNFYQPKQTSSTDTGSNFNSTFSFRV